MVIIFSRCRWPVAPGRLHIYPSKALSPRHTNSMLYFFCFSISYVALETLGNSFREKIKYK